MLKKKKKTLGKLAAGACPRSRRHSTEKFDSRFLNNKKKIKLYFKNQVKIFLLLKKLIEEIVLVECKAQMSCSRKTWVQVTNWVLSNSLLHSGTFTYKMDKEIITPCLPGQSRESPEVCGTSLHCPCVGSY